MSVRARVSNLEKKAHAADPGQVVVVRLLNLSTGQRIEGAQAEKRIAEAHEEAGPGGNVVILEWAETWPPVEVEVVNA